jgi:hypothetical protein
LLSGGCFLADILVYVGKGEGERKKDKRKIKRAIKKQ